MKFKCTDLETTSIDVATCEVVQAAVVTATATDCCGLDLDDVKTSAQLFFAADIPAAASAVHGITADKVVDCPRFASVVRSFVSALTEPGTVVVTFNGTAYDLPIVARYLRERGPETVAAAFRVQADSDHDDPKVLLSQSWIEMQLRARHIDVMRLWQYARAQRREPWWRVNVGDNVRVLPLHAECFSGSLTAAHAFWLGEVFDAAHDASVDCLATLRVLDAMLRSGFVDVETAIRWSNQPMPGDCDMAGKFKWDGDQCVIAFGKFKGSPIENVDRGFLSWVLRSDFPEDTKTLVQDYLAGSYPARREAV